MLKKSFHRLNFFSCNSFRLKADNIYIFFFYENYFRSSYKWHMLKKKKIILQFFDQETDAEIPEYKSFFVVESNRDVSGRFLVVPIRLPPTRNRRLWCHGFFLRQLSRFGAGGGINPDMLFLNVQH